MLHCDRSIISPMYIQETLAITYYSLGIVASLLVIAEIVYKKSPLVQYKRDIFESPFPSIVDKISIAPSPPTVCLPLIEPVQRAKLLQNHLMP